MLGRKQSLRGDLVLTDYGPEDLLNESSDIEWVNKNWVRWLLRTCSLLSLLSVSANTPATIAMYPNLKYVTFICDSVITFFFTAEMIAKMNKYGILKGELPYLKDRWCQYDAVMVFFLWVSVILQIFEMTGVVAAFSPLSVLRAPRPLIVVRIIRIFLTFSMPKSRLKQIVKRSSQQINNVTLFFLFFLSLYGLLGVQLFGKIESHCVLNSTDPREITINSLAIPDTFCSEESDSGYQCPEGMKCISLNLDRKVSGFNGFDNFATSIFTVYQAASQEGWVLIMYRTIDALPNWRATFFFSTMIFFLSWLVKNVFIAVITETFNEIRVQFQQMWGARVQIQQETKSQVLMGDNQTWKLLYVDDNKPKGWAPPHFLKHIQSAFFYLVIMAAIVANAMVAASIYFEHDTSKKRSDFYQYVYNMEIGFVLFFNMEVLIKLWCMGFRGYFRLTIHKFEFLLAVGTTIRLIPSLFMTALTYFQVLRVVRLIKASPILEDFVYKIFGPGKKLGSLILFTMCLLIITSSISMQLFCFNKEYNKFETFADAFMSMFQIVTQEGWVDVMDETMIHTMNRTRDEFAPLVAVYFILYHLFVTLIVLSLFVAVILDNLELDEDFKKLKQMKAREQSAGIQDMLPLRLRIFEKFPDRPSMAKLHKTPSDFSLPKVRESFLRQYLEEERDEEEEMLMQRMVETENFSISYRKRRQVGLLCVISRPRNADFEQKKTAVTGIICEANYQRLLIGDSGNIPLPKSAFPPTHGATRHQRLEQKSFRRSVRGSLKMKTHHFDHLKENGDIGAMNRTLSTRKMHDLDIKMLQAKKQQAELRRNQREEDLRENHPYFDTPLFVVGRESRFRKLCQSIVYARYDTSHKDPITGKERKVKYKKIRNLLGLVTYLDWLMILITTVSCASMMLETPKFRVMENAQLQVAEYVFVVFMSVELALRILADGLLFTPKALIRDMAGVLDLFIYMVSLVFVCWLPKEISPQSGAHLLLVLRCLRPLRIFNLVPHMRQVVSELVRGFKEILLVSVLLIVLLFVFASYGVQLYGGRLASCNDVTVVNRSDCHGFFMRKIFVTKMKLGLGDDHPAILVPRVWTNPGRFNFDNIGNAMLALFEVLSFKGWLDIRDVLVLRLGSSSAIYIHLFIFLGSMIGLTLFVGVVIANYSENKGTALLTVDQRRWCDLKKRLKIAQPLHLPPRPDGRKFRAFIYDITQNISFKRFVAFAVIANSSLLFVHWYEDNFVTGALVVTSSFLNLVFVAEVVMKLIAFTPRGYWQSRRNRYDFIVTVLGVAWVGLNFTFRTEETLMFGFMVIILRFFTITGKHPTLKMLMLTVVVSVFKSFFIIMGMFLLILSYALAGSILFGNVKYGEKIARQANFETAPGGITLLFRIVTGEDWNKIMHDCMITPPFCTLGRNYWETDCGNFTASLIFFCSFYVIITYIVLNLLVAIIMENFSLFYSNEEDALLSYADIRNFQNTWNIVDSNQRGVIPVRRVKFILRLLKGRLEVDPAKDRLLFKHMCYELERLHNGDDVTFHDVLNMLSYRSVDIRKSLQLEELMAREELEYIIEEEVAKQTIRSWLDNCLKRIRSKEQDPLVLPQRELLELRPSASSDKEGDKDKETDSKEGDRRGDWKKLSGMARTDSLTSVSGRKYLAPVFTSDSVGGREKHARTDSKGRKVSTGVCKTPSGVAAGASAGGSDSAAARDTAVAAAAATTEDISLNRASLPRSASGSTEVREWWKELVGYDSGNEGDS